MSSRNQISVKRVASSSFTQYKPIGCIVQWQVSVSLSSYAKKQLQLLHIPYRMTVNIKCFFAKLGYDFQSSERGQDLFLCGVIQTVSVVLFVVIINACACVRVCVCVCQSADSELSQFAVDQLELEQLRHDLAQYFCDDVATFQLDDCIATLNTFVQQFIKAVNVRYLPLPYVYYRVAPKTFTTITNRH